MIQKYGANYWENASNMVELPAAEVLQQRIAYAAVVSFTDAQIGTVLAALDAPGAAPNTIIILWATMVGAYSGSTTRMQPQRQAHLWGAQTEELRNSRNAGAISKFRNCPHQPETGSD